MSDVATDLSDPDALALMRATIGAGPDGGHACVADRHAQLAAMLDRVPKPATVTLPMSTRPQILCWDRSTTGRCSPLHPQAQLGKGFGG